MNVEIKGRELTATYHQGRLYIPKSFRDMFGLRNDDILVIKIVEHSHGTKRKSALNMNLDKSNLSQESSGGNRKDTPAPFKPDYTKPFKLVDEEETSWDDEE